MAPFSIKCICYYSIVQYPYFCTHNVLNDGRTAPQMSHYKLDCILSKSDDHVEAARVGWALDQLTAAMNARLSL